MRDYSVPIITYLVELDYAGGRLLGRVFLPTHSDRRDGEPRLDDWLNGPPEFFPFLPEGERETVLLNKGWITALGLEDRGEGLPVPEPAGSPLAVVAELEGRRVEAWVHVDMPPPHRRLLDVVNRPEPFLALWTEARLLLVRKRLITRIHESEASE